MTEAEITPGSLVRLVNLNKKGVVVRKVNKRDYLVRVGATELRISSEQLAPIEGKVSKDLSRSGTLKAQRKTTNEKCAKLDLHGMTVSEAIRLLEKKINSSILQNYRGIEIIHGIGSGRIRNAVYKYSSESEVVAEIRPDPSNSGVSWMYFYSN